MITYTLTEADILAGNRLWRRRRTRPVAIVALFCLVWAAMAVYGVIVSHDPLIPAVVIGLLTAVVAIPCLLLIRSRTASKRVLRAFRSSADGLKPTEAAWNDRCISFRRQDKSAEHPWADFIAYAESKSVIALFRTGAIVHPLPKRAFTDEQLQSLRDYLQPRASENRKNEA